MAESQSKALQNQMQNQAQESSRKINEMKKLMQAKGIDVSRF